MKEHKEFEDLVAKAFDEMENGDPVNLAEYAETIVQCFNNVTSICAGMPISVMISITEMLFSATVLQIMHETPGKTALEREAFRQAMIRQHCAGIEYHMDHQADWMPALGKEDEPVRETQP